MNKTRLCLFAMYSPTGSLMNFRKTYLEELARHCEKIIVVAAEYIDSESQKYLKSKGLAFYVYPNNGFDFGLWYNVLQEEEICQYDEVMLVNDSCVLVKTLDKFFQWANTHKELDYFGLTSHSIEVAHIQSYFLVWRKAITQTVSRYFDIHGIIKGNSDDITDKTDVINIYEIGLSNHLRKKKVRMWAQYPVTMSMSGMCMTQYSVPYLMERGFPLIKRDVLQYFIHSLEEWSKFDVKLLLEGMTDKKQPRYDENLYLELHPEVRKLVEDKKISCGWEYWRRNIFPKTDCTSSVIV